MDKLIIKKMTLDKEQFEDKVYKGIICKLTLNIILMTQADLKAEKWEPEKKRLQKIKPDKKLKNNQRTISMRATAEVNKTGEESAKDHFKTHHDNAAFHLHSQSNEHFEDKETKL